jgi:hypothetical protein
MQTTVILRLSPADLERLDQLADHVGCSRTEILRRSLRLYYYDTFPGKLGAADSKPQVSVDGRGKSKRRGKEVQP